MKKSAFIGIAMVVLLFGNCTQAGVSVIKNSGFENDGRIDNITTKPPQYWRDVSVPSKFGGYLSQNWSTYVTNGYSLSLVSKAGSAFTIADKAMISQQVYLTQTGKIIFDIQLTGTHSSFPWNSEKFSAVVQIDGTDIWDSKNWVPNGNGTYTFEADINTSDSNLHTLSLVMRANKSATHATQYRASWDFVKFDGHCGGFGYLPEDLNHDCYVDINDFGLLAEQWLTKDPNYRYDLFEDDQGIVDFRDYSVFAASWLDNSDWRNWPANNCYVSELLEADLNDDGIVNLQDFAILAGDWLGYSDAANIKGDINRSKRVDYDDISIMAEEWLMTNWLYGLN